jgi:hypothetical protein
VPSDADGRGEATSSDPADPVAPVGEEVGEEVDEEVDEE